MKSQDLMKTKDLMKSQEASQEKILEITNLSLSLASSSPASSSIPLVQEVNLTIHKGEILGLVGESGSGKSIFALSLLGLLARNEVVRTKGEITYYASPHEIWPLETEADFTRVRSQHINMIFQEPTSFLNPLLHMKTQLHEVFHIHKKEVDEQRIIDLFDQMGLADKERIYQSYPHQLSGGMLQRVFFVMTLLLHPRLIIADEPTTALDLTNQKRLLNIMREVSLRENVAIILITHNIHLVRLVAQRIVSMVGGYFVEMGEAQELLENPAHPYTEGLLNAAPKFHRGRPPKDYSLRPLPKGDATRESDSDACVFYARCSKRQTACKQMPDWHATVHGKARCILAQK